MKMMRVVLLGGLLVGYISCFQIPPRNGIKHQTNKNTSRAKTLQASKDSIDRLRYLLPVAFSAALFLNPQPQDHLQPPNALATVEEMAPVRSSIWTPTGSALASTTMASAATSTTITKSIITSETPRSGSVMDLAHVISNQEQLAIFQAIQQAQDRTGTEIQIITVDQIPRDTTPKQMATTLFNQWRIGPASRNNGVLILAVLDQRRVEIEVGKGIGREMNADWCSQTLQEVATPSFRQQKYGTGILNTVRRVAHKLEEIDRDAARAADAVVPTTTIVGVQNTATTVRRQLVPKEAIASSIMFGVLAFSVVVEGTVWAIRSTRSQSSVQQEDTRRKWKLEGLNQEALSEQRRKEADLVRRAEELGRRMRSDKLKKRAQKNRPSSRRNTSNQTNYNRSSSTRYESSDYYDSSESGRSWGSSGSSSGSSSSADDSGGYSDGDGGGADW